MATQKPLRILCAREIQKSIKDSVKRLIDDKIKMMKLEGFFTSTDTEVRGENGSLFLFAGLRSNPESIKSMEGINICWVEEANKVSGTSLELLVPTIRQEESEIWFSWNPDTELDPVDMMFRGEHVPPDSIVRMVNYKENPFFPEVLKKEMEFDRQTDPEKYQHIWMGGYKAVFEGAYYAKQLAALANKGNIRKVPHDPHAEVYAAFDLGISDATAIWLAQFVGHEVRFIEYFESTGQPIDWYAKELRSRGYNYAPLILPHDARARQLGTGKTVEEILRSLGFETVICPKISVKDGIEAVRKTLNDCYFDEKGCQDGLRALREYRVNYDEKRRLDRGPLHDWTSHAADAMRYMSVGRKPREGRGSALDAAQAYMLAMKGKTR
jgi:phage terminase large subunit